MRPVIHLFCLLLASHPLSAAESIGGRADARAARSVHLQWQAEEATVFLLEMTVEQSTDGSYFMACGWSGGYFGVQQLVGGRKVAIFSVWDPVKGDDQRAVKPEDRVELLHQDGAARIKRFGGEGTGGQCMLDFPWEVGQRCRLLVQAEAAEGKTAYAGWLFDPATNTWRHLVTFRTRTGGKLLRGLYSFVEDFRRDGRSVDEVRSARFAVGWTRTVAGEWRALERARFTASRAEWEARDNIDAGPAGPGYFLTTGGATLRHAELGSALPPLPAPGALPVDLPPLVTDPVPRGATRPARGG